MFRRSAENFRVFRTLDRQHSRRLPSPTSQTRCLPGSPCRLCRPQRPPWRATGPDLQGRLFLVRGPGATASIWDAETRAIVPAPPRGLGQASMRRNPIADVEETCGGFIQVAEHGRPGPRSEHLQQRDFGRRNGAALPVGLRQRRRKASRSRRRRCADLVLDGIGLAVDASHDQSAGAPRPCGRARSGKPSLRYPASPSGDRGHPAEGARAPPGSCGGASWWPRKKFARPAAQKSEATPCASRTETLSKMG